MSPCQRQRNLTTWLLSTLLTLAPAMIGTLSSFTWAQAADAQIDLEGLPSNSPLVKNLSDSIRAFLEDYFTVKTVAVDGRIYVPRVIRTATTFESAPVALFEVFPVKGEIIVGSEYWERISLYFFLDVGEEVSTLYLVVDAWYSSSKRPPGRLSDYTDLENEHSEELSFYPSQLLTALWNYYFPSNEERDRR